MGFFRDNAEVIKEIFSALREGLKTIITVAIEPILTLITSFLLLLQGDFQGAWEAIKQGFSTWVEAFKSMLSVF
ncbi:MAG: hypothetical protein LBD75_07445 [Candidatus Peribacteria bacterium]|nr:hypothetical protein [Candidatus Peribacteria bacterium]